MSCGSSKEGAEEVIHPSADFKHCVCWGICQVPFQRELLRQNIIHSVICSTFLPRSTELIIQLISYTM